MIDSSLIRTVTEHTANAISGVFNSGSSFTFFPEKTPADPNGRLFINQEHAVLQLPRDGTLLDTLHAAFKGN